MFFQNRGKKADGNEGFMEDICMRTWKDLYRFIYYKVQNKEEAEDITQETYAKAIKVIQNGNLSIENYSNYFKSIALNIIRDKWRYSNRYGVNLDIENISPDDLSIDDFSEQSANRNVIEQALNSISEDQRRVIELRIIKGFTVSETARILKKKESTIRVIQYRGLQALALILKTSGL
jgi:RNA polymerase sigma-70 factor, ECF subfamily